MPPHLHRRKGRKIWEIVEGRKRTSTGTSRRILAEKVLEIYYLRGKGVTVNSNEPISKHIAPYLAQSEQFNKSSTLDDKGRTLRYFADYCLDGRLDSIQTAGVVGYLTNRRGARSKKPISAERWNSERQIISNFFRWLMGRRLIDHNPATGVEKKKVVRSKIPKALSVSDERKLLAWCRVKDPELYRLAVVAGNTGLRVRELANLQREDVAGSTINVTAKLDWQPKDYEERAIPKNPQVERVIRRQLRGNLSRWVFPRKDGLRYGRGLDLRMVRAFKSCGLGSGGFHRLRHTFATRFLEAGGDPETLRRLMGHSDLKTLTKYAHVSPDEKSLTFRFCYGL